MCAVGSSLYAAAQCAEQMTQLFGGANISDTKLVYGQEGSSPAPSTHAGPGRPVTLPEYIITAELPGPRQARAAPHVLQTSKYRGVASDVMTLCCDGSCKHDSQRAQSEGPAPADLGGPPACPRTSLAPSQGITLPPPSPFPSLAPSQGTTLPPSSSFLPPPPTHTSPTQVLLPPTWGATSARTRTSRLSWALSRQRKGVEIRSGSACGRSRGQWRRTARYGGSSVTSHQLERSCL